MTARGVVLGRRLKVDLHCVTVTNRVALLVCMALTCGNAHAQNVDLRVLRSINLDRNERFDHTFELVSESVLPVGLAVPVTELAIGLATGNQDLKRDAATTAASYVMAYGITTVLKYTVNRPRPFVTYPYLENLETPNDPSFPSGHTTGAFATATSLTLAFKKWYVAVPAYAWAGAVGYSRMHLGVHYPSDVAVGALVGSGSAWLCYVAQKRLTKKRQAVP